LAALAFLQARAIADVKPHALISDNMVLQQGSRTAIFGTVDEGEEVTVQLQDHKATATAKDGKWIAWLEDLKAGGPYDLTISGKNTVHIKNVLVGEVWICSGQSNMEWSLLFTTNSQEVAKQSHNPMLRLFTVTKRPASAPLSNVHGNWVEAGPNTVLNFSAVGYYFGRDVQKARNVPVGLIHTSWGGTPAEAWTSRDALEAEPSLKYMADKQAQALKQYPSVLEKYRGTLKKYEERVPEAEAAGHDLPDTPALPTNPARNPGAASTLYNGMIASLIPYGIRGAIWYQGESNAGRAYEYRTLLPTMIKSWRTAWNEGDFPFLIVQLAPFTKIRTEPGESAWAELREAQLLTTQKVPNTAEAVITDVGEEMNIHPVNKESVGARLALAARALAYGEQIESSGPVYSEMKVEGNRAILSFTHEDGGLEAKGVPLTGFTIAGDNHKFVKAQAHIEGDKVVVSSPHVSHPVAVRFGWADYPVVNLWNKAGLPATPFRTDDFPGITQPHGHTSAAR
jgi:sialate O-acetylesterase